MKFIIQKIIKIILWALSLFFLTNQLIFSILAVIVSTKGGPLTDVFTHSYARIWLVLNWILIPMSIVVLIILDNKKVLPKIFRTNDINGSLDFKLFFKDVMSSLFKWFIFGMCPFLVVATFIVFVNAEKASIFVPIGILYVEYVFLILFFRQLRKTRK